jgi:MFS family permease
VARDEGVAAAGAGGVAVPILALTLGHVFSNAVRTLPAVAADVLAADLNLSAEGLAAVTAVFPASFALAMVPTGVALDRYGVRRTALALLAVGAVGAVLAALAGGAAGMLLAQAVLGVGCSGMLMCPVTFAARALPLPRFALWSGIIQAFGNTGMLLSASPLALLVEWRGWQAGFWASAALAVLAWTAVALAVPEPPLPRSARRTVWQDAREVVTLARSPALRPLMVFAFASFAAVLGVRGLWGGPWLMEVKGLGRVEAGNLLLLCTAALTLGPALAGVVDRLLGRRAALMAGSHTLVALLVLLMAAGGPGGPLASALGLPVLPPAFDGMLLALSARHFLPGADLPGRARDGARGADRARAVRHQHVLSSAARRPCRPFPASPRPPAASPRRCAPSQRRCCCAAPAFSCCSGANLRWPRGPVKRP